MCANIEFRELLINPGKQVTEMKEITANKTGKPLKSSITHTNMAASAVVPKMLKADMLYLGAAYTKDIFEWIATLAARFQESTFYKIVTRTTQPAHLIAACVMLGVGMLVCYPSTEDCIGADQQPRKQQPLIALAYLTAFATHFGTQVWMTFVSGLALYFSLPRHTFGLCQEILFPKYFAMNSVLSIITLVLFARSRNGHWDNASMVQVGALGLCATIEMIVRLYLAPPILHLMRAKNCIEASAGKGTEIGHIDAGDLTKCQNYMVLQKAFRKVHMSAAIGNIIAMACTFLHLQYLASRLMVL